MWVTRSLSLFYHSVNCILRRLPRVQEITFHCFYSQGLMIFKVPPSDLHKNANLAELRCNKKKNFVLVFSLHWVFWSASLSPQLCFTCMLLSHEKKKTMHVQLAICRLLCSTSWNYFHSQKNLETYSKPCLPEQNLNFIFFKCYIFQISSFHS